MSRIYQSAGYTIEYPNELAYAGMPAIVKMTNATQYVGVGLTIVIGGEDYYTETRELNNGDAIFDISRYLQLAFRGASLGYSYDDSEGNMRDSSIPQKVTVVVKFTEANGSSDPLGFTFTINALFGYLGIGQTNGGGYRKRKLFVNYPQTIDFYGDNDSVISYAGVNGENAGVFDNTEGMSNGITQAYVSFDEFVYGDMRELNVILDNIAYISGDKLARGYSEYRMVRDDSKSGVYLRWLDHFGHWCYYIFRVTGRNYTTKAEESWQDGILRNPMKSENGVFLADGIAHQQMSQAENVSLGAKLVDAETFDYLLTLTSSPIVEVLTNVEEWRADRTTPTLWERVNIVAGSYARTGAPLQDFVVSIARTAHKSQML